MALWGTRDSFSVTGTVDVSNNTTAVAGDANTVFTTELDIGDALILNGRRRKIASVDSANTLTLADDWTGGDVTGGTAFGQDIPKYVPASEVTANNIIGVDDTEAQLAANKARGITTPGWTKYVTYTDMHGTTRYKTEVLVVMSSATTGDAPDDDVAADS